MQRVGHGPQMLTGVVKVQPLRRLSKAVLYQVPDPQGAIGDDQNLCRLAHALAQTFGKELFTQRIDSPSRHNGAAAQNDRSPGVGLGPLIQTKAGPAINPVPARRLDTLGPSLLAFAPIVPFPNVPGIDFDNQRKGFLFQRQALLAALALAHLLVQFLAFALGSLALPTSFSIQRRRGQLPSP